MKPTPEQVARAQEATELRMTPIETWIAMQSIGVRGATAEPIDVARLNEQTARVYAAVRDLRPWTLKSLAAKTGDPEASVSARLREIRRYLHEGSKGTILRERVEGGNGLHTYTMRLNKYSGAA